MGKLLVATTNPGKLKEFREALAVLGMNIVSLKDFPDILPVEETGNTFEENAKLKAKAYYARTKLPTLADDAGLEIDALGGEPGVKSRRWIDGEHEATDEELVAYALKRLEGVSREKRTARLRTVIAFFDGKTMRTATDATEGVIAEEAAKEIEAGYPFRSLLWLPEFQKLYKDLTPAEHAKANHRLRALEELKPFMSTEAGAA